MPGLDDVQLNLITGLDDIFKFREWLGNRRPLNAIGFDCETDGFDRHNGKVRLIQFGDHEVGWAMDRDDWQGLARWTFENFEGDFIGHNAPFDVDFLANSCKIKVPTHRVHDTLVRSAILEPHLSKALKNQAGRHVDPVAAGLQEVLKGTSFTWETVPTAYGPYWQYGALYPVLTYHLEMHHRPLVERDAPRAYEIEMAVLWVVSKMSRNGAFVDRPFAQRYLTEFENYCTSVDRWCQTEYKVRPGSNAAIVGILQEAGYTFTKATAAGAVALDKEVLEGMRLYGEMHRFVNRADEENDAADLVFDDVPFQVLEERAVLTGVSGIDADVDELADLFIDGHFLDQLLGLLPRIFRRFETSRRYRPR